MKIQASLDSSITYTGYGKDCGGFTPPQKGQHLDDQTEAFKNCKRKKSKKKKKSFNLKEYKIAENMRQKSLPEGGIIETISPTDLSPDKIEKIKAWLEQKFPNQYWDLKSVYDYIKFKLSGEYPSERNTTDIDEIRKPYKGWTPQNVKR